MIKAFDDIKKEILSFLFEKYMEQASGRYAIAHIIDPYDVSATDFIFILKQDGLVEEHLAESMAPAYSITVAGINEIEPDYFADRLASVMNEAGLGHLDWVSVTEVTGIHDTKRVADIGEVLKVTDFFEVEAGPADVRAKLTDKGKAYFEEHRKEFI